jgi:hypothetical protein
MIDPHGETNYRALLLAQPSLMAAEQFLSNAVLIDSQRG